MTDTISLSRNGVVRAKRSLCLNVILILYCVADSGGNGGGAVSLPVHDTSIKFGGEAADTASPLLPRRLSHHDARGWRQEPGIMKPGGENLQEVVSCRARGELIRDVKISFTKIGEVRVSTRPTVEPLTFPYLSLIHISE